MSLRMFVRISKQDTINMPIIKSPRKNDKDEKIPFHLVNQVYSTPLQKLYQSLQSQVKEYKDWRKSIPKDYLLKYSQVKDALVNEKTLHILIGIDQKELIHGGDGIHEANSLAKYGESLDRDQLQHFYECKETGLALFGNEKFKSILVCNLPKLDPFK